MTGPVFNISGGNPVFNLGGPGGDDAAADAGGRVTKTETKADKSPTDPGTAAAGSQAATRVGDTAGKAAPPAPKGEPVKGVPGLGKRYWDATVAPSKWLGAKAPGWLPDGAGEFSKDAAKWGGRFVPFAGNLISLGHAGREFQSGDYIGGVLGLVGAVPGPVGWLGIGASFAWNYFGPPSESRYATWAEPDGVRTQMLPAAAADVANVVAFDAAITEAQKAVFGFEMGPTGTVWNVHHPAALRVDGATVKQAVDRWLGDLALTVRDIEATLGSSAEPYLAAAHARLQPYLNAMRDLPAASQVIHTHLGAASDAAGDLYQTVLDANAGARTALAAGNGLSGSDFSIPFQTAQGTAAKNLENANTLLAGACAGNSLSPLAPVQRMLPPPRNNDLGAGAVMPPMPPLTPAAPLTPVAPAAAAAAEEDADKNTDDISDILSKLGNNLGGGTPLGGGMPGLGGMPLGGLGGGQPLGGGTPLATPTPKPLAPEAKPVLGTERRNLSGAPVENKVVPAAEKKLDEKKNVAAPVPGAAASAAPAPDKLGEPKVKSVSSQPEKPDTTVDVKGKKIEFPDAKTAALASELAKATPGSPASLADAATKAGLVPPVPGQDPGQQVAPADAKPGDLLVAGDKSYMLLGDGSFLDHTNGKVVDADQMPKDLGTKGGYFSLQEAGSGDPSGPVSGQAPATTTMTVDQDPKIPAAVPATGVTSAGTPGVPSQGAPGSGPANASATDTGRGTGSVPVMGGKPLDPAAIK